MSGLFCVLRDFGEIQRDDLLCEVPRESAWYGEDGEAFARVRNGVMSYGESAADPVGGDEGNAVAVRA